MSSKPPMDVLAIVTDCLASAEAQVRRNAATALAAAGTWKSASPLVDLALRDPDASVRRRAFDGLLQLDDDAQRAAAQRTSDVFQELSATGDSADEGEEPEERLEVLGRANEILAAVRQQGIPFAIAERHFLRRFALFWKVRHYLLRHRLPQPFWRPVVLAFLGALAGAALTAALFARWNPFLGEHVTFGILLPAAFLATILTAALSHHQVPAGSYCDPHMGALVETAGLLWRPFSLPIALAAIAAFALITLMVGFAGLELKAFRILSWLLLSCLALSMILMAMRGVTTVVPRLGRAAATLAGALAGLAAGFVVLLGLFRIWPHPGVAILASEGALITLPLAAAFACERLLSPIAAARGPAPSRLLVSTLIALLIVLLPGLWIHFNPLQPLAASPGAELEEEWRWTHVPVHRSFRIDFVQTVRARLGDEGFRPVKDLDLRLTRQGRKIDSDQANEGWLLWKDLVPGDYRLEVTVRDRNLEKGALSFLVRESYASVVGLLARRLLESFGENPPASLVEPFRLQLVLNSKTGASGSERSP